MASLTGQSVASSYEQLLHVDRDGGGNGTTLVDVKDGDNGTTFALKLATDKIQVDGTSLIDVTDTEAFLVRKDSDGGDVFVVDTTNVKVGIGGQADSYLYLDGLSGNTYFHYNHNDVIDVYTGGDIAMRIKDDDVEFNGAIVPKSGITGNATNFDIHQTSDDASDNRRTRIGGGGDVSQTRGAYIELAGNEHSNTGQLILNAGDVTGGDIIFKTDNTTRLMIDDTTGNVGIGTTSPDSKLHIVNPDGGTYRFGFSGSSDVYVDADNFYWRTDNGGANQMTLTTTGLGIGVTAPEAQLNIAKAGSSDNATFNIDTFSSGINNQSVIGLRKSNSNSVGTETTVRDDEKLGKIAWYGGETDGYDEAASIHAEVDGTPGSNDTDMPGALVFSTTADGTGSSAERMRITSVGNVLPGADDAQDLGSSSKRFDDIYATNATIQTSDKRLKDNIADSSLGLDFLNGLRPVEYQWKDYSYDVEKEKAVESKEAIYETVVVQEAVEAKEAVMDTRQKTVSKEVEKTRTEIVEEDGKYVQKEISYTETVEEPQYEEADLYDEDGEVIGSHKIPIMEEYEVEPAIEAIEEVTEERLVSEAIEAKDAVMETKEKTFARKHFGLIAQEVEQVLKDNSLTNNDFAGLIYDEDADKYGMRYHELIAPLIKAVQELSAKVEALESK